MGIINNSPWLLELLDSSATYHQYHAFQNVSNFWKLLFLLFCHIKFYAKRNLFSKCKLATMPEVRELIVFKFIVY